MRFLRLKEIIANLHGHAGDDFGVARAFQRVKAETNFLPNFTGWKARATLVAAAAL
jgi:hypothetical protein